MKIRVLSFIRHIPNSIYNIVVKYLTRLRIGFSHLKQHKFKHNFQNSIYPIYNCSSGIERTIYFFLNCASFNSKSQILFHKAANIDANTFTENEYIIVKFIWIGKQTSENSFNKAMLNVSTEFIL